MKRTWKFYLVMLTTVGIGVTVTIWSLLHLQQPTPPAESEGTMLDYLVDPFLTDPQLLPVPERAPRIEIPEGFGLSRGKLVPVIPPVPIEEDDQK